VLALAISLAMALVLSSCATLGATDVCSTGRLLTGAGFRAEPADTPERLAELESMPPLTLVARPGNGDLVYTYADPYHCRCIYVGGPTEHAAYQRLAAQRALDSRDAASEWEGWNLWWWRRGIAIAESWRQQPGCLSTHTLSVRPFSCSSLITGRPIKSPFGSSGIAF